MTSIPKNWSLWTRQEIVLILAILMLAGMAAYLAIKLAQPQPIAGALIGDRWQCSKTAFITTCTKRPA